MTEKREVRKHEANHYVNDGEFYDAMVPWINTCNEIKKVYFDEHRCTDIKQLPPEVREQLLKELPVLTELMGENIWKIVNGLSRKPNFSGYTWKYLMIDDAIENCIKYLHNFNPDKYKSPYSYVNFIAYRAFIRRIKKEKKRLAGQQEYIKSLGGYTHELFTGDENSNMQEQIITDNVTQFFDNGCYSTKTRGVE